MGSFPSLSEAFGSPYSTSLVAKIHDLESQMLEGNLVLVGDDGKPLKSSNEASLMWWIRESIMFDDIGGTLNAANQGMKMDDSGKKNGNT